MYIYHLGTSNVLNGEKVNLKKRQLCFRSIYIYDHLGTSNVLNG